MENDFLSDTEKAIDIYYGYIKLAQMAEERFKPFAALLEGFGLSTFIFTKHIPLLRKMDSALSFDMFYNDSKEYIENTPSYIIFPFKRWLKACKDKDIITSSEHEMLSDLLKRVSDRKIDQEEWQSALGDAEASEYYEIIVKEA